MITGIYSAFRSVFSAEAEEAGFPFPIFSGTDVSSLSFPCVVFSLKLTARAEPMKANRTFDCVASFSLFLQPEQWTREEIESSVSRLAVLVGGVDRAELNLAAADYGVSFYSGLKLSTISAPTLSTVGNVEMLTVGIDAETVVQF